MTALEKALSIYGAEEFSRLQRIYTMFGHTVTSPDYIAFARPCKEETSEQFTDEGHDAWFIELVVGNGRMEQLIKMLPYDLPRIGWKRGLKGRDTVKFYDLDKIKQLLKD